MLLSEMGGPAPACDSDVDRPAFKQLRHRDLGLSGLCLPTRHGGQMHTWNPYAQLRGDAETGMR